MLSELDGLPKGVLELPATRLHQVLKGPTLIHLPGREERPLFLSVLLHGNEDTGWEAVRSLLTDYRERPLPRALSLFIGNVAAAREGLRRLPGQCDYNRIWGPGDSPEHAMAAQLVARMAERRVFASIDIHNNTGRNPHYGCINRLERQFLHLAILFSRTVVYFIEPATVQSMGFSAICPAVTVECGKPGVPQGVEHARQFIEAALHLRHFPDHPVAPHDYDLFHTVATVTVPEEVSFAFNGASGVGLSFPPDLDQLNFQELPAGILFARTGSPPARLVARDEYGNDVSARHFRHEQGQIRTRIPLMPSMLTLDARVIRQDCLCYLMERLPPVE